MSRPAESYSAQPRPEDDLYRPATPIGGLYMAGQDVASSGVFGALSGGMLTAHAVLGYGFIDLVLLKRNLISDIATLA